MPINLSGSLVLTGSLTSTLGFTGPLSGTASYSSNADMLDGLDSTVFTQTGSFNTFSSSILTYTGSTNSRLNSLESNTGSYATTGSNTFIGTQTISGSIFGSGSLTINGCITSTGQIVAQTINVQQVTSSIVYSCGSNIFGTNISNTQQLTGSVGITGSLTIAGASSATSYNGATIFGSTIACSPIGCFATSCATSFIGGTMSGTTIYGSTAVCSPVGKFTSCIDAGSGTFSGNVVIGGSSPVYLKFNVQETAANRVAILYRGTQGGDASMITAFGTPYLSIGGQENLVNSIQTIGFGFTNGTTYTQPAEIGFQTTSTSGYTCGDLVFATRGATTNTVPTERMRITSAGNVGIGTCTPVGKLDVTLVNTRRFIVTYDDSIITIKGASDTGAGENLRMIGDNLIFNTNSVGSGTERMRITRGGNVGIGTSTPSSFGNYTNVTIKGGSSGANLDFFNSAGTRLANFVLNGSISAYVGTVTDIPFDITQNDATRLRVAVGGNVGIGTNSPQAILSVKGATNNTVIEFDNGGATKAFMRSYDRTAGAYREYEMLANELLFSTGASPSERMRITSGGNVGIGTSSPTTYSLSGSHIENYGGSNYAFIHNNTANVKSFLATNESAGVTALFTFSNHPLAFGTNNTERMRITSGGVVLIGASSITNSGFLLNVLGNPTSTIPLARYFVNGANTLSIPAIRFDKFDNDSTTSQVFIDFTINNQNSGSGSITANGASQAAFTSWSDKRLKENITDLPNQLSNIMALRPVEFDYKDGSGHQIGFIAQEVQEVYSDIVGENAEGYLTISGLGKMESRLIKAIQELEARVQYLENK